MDAGCSQQHAAHDGAAGVNCCCNSGDLNINVRPVVNADHKKEEDDVSISVVPRAPTTRKLNPELLQRITGVEAGKPDAGAAAVARETASASAGKRRNPGRWVKKRATELARVVGGTPVRQDAPQV